jgi:hypothetical protein
VDRQPPVPLLVPAAEQPPVDRQPPELVPVPAVEQQPVDRQPPVPLRQRRSRHLREV